MGGCEAVEARSIVGRVVLEISLTVGVGKTVKIIKLINKVYVLTVPAPATTRSSPVSVLFSSFGFLFAV